MLSSVTLIDILSAHCTSVLAQKCGNMQCANSTHNAHRVQRCTPLTLDGHHHEREGVHLVKDGMLSTLMAA